MSELGVAFVRNAQVRKLERAGSLETAESEREKSPKERLELSATVCVREKPGRARDRAPAGGGGEERLKARLADFALAFGRF